MKRAGSAQRDGGSGVAAAWMLWRWRQRNNATLAEAWRRRGGGGSAKRGGGALRDSGSVVSIAQRLRRIRRHRP